VKMTGFFFGVEGGKMSNKEVEGMSELEQRYSRFVKELREGGFEIEVVGSDRQLAGVDRRDAMDCGDDRLAKGRGESLRKTERRAPKIFGGTLGIATLLAYREGRTEITQDDILKAKQLIEEAGYVAGVHDLSGYDGWEEVHCGYAMLLGQGRLGFRFAENVTIDWVTSVVGKKNQVKLVGEHEAVRTVVNFKKDKTIKPNGSSFGLDPWVLEKMGFNDNEVDWLLALSVKVLNGLNGPEKVVIVK